MKIIIKVIIVL